MNDLFSGFKGRFIRALVSKLLADGIALWQGNPNYVWLLPVFLSLSKALRDKWPGKLEWLPI